MKYVFFTLLLVIFTTPACYAGSLEYKCDTGDCQNGYGTMTWSDGQKYVGEWKDGKTNGQGTRTWPNGIKYVGEEKNGQQNGHGMFTWPNGMKFVGEFKDDKKNGQAVVTWPDGRKSIQIYNMGELISDEEIRPKQHSSPQKSVDKKSTPPSGHRWKKAVD